jgi:hypothetical protein
MIVIMTMTMANILDNVVPFQFVLNPPPPSQFQLCGSSSTSTLSAIHNRVHKGEIFDMQA